MKMRFLLPALFLFAGVAVTSGGEKSHGLALYGPQDLKYKPGQPYRYANPKAPKGGMLRLSGYGAPYTKLNPFTLKGSAAPFIGTLVFEMLMDGSDDDNEPFSQYGVLAKQVSVADDKTSMTYYLNPNARFSDGKALTAEDVVFSWNLIFDPDMPPFYRQYYADVEKCEKIDDHTVRFHFKKFNQELPLIMGQLHILPKHIYGKPGTSFGNDFNDKIPVGSGPYVVSSFKMGEEITFKRNPAYWGRDIQVNKGRYNFDVIYYRNFLDAIGHKNSIKAGRTDVEWVSRARDWVTEYNAKELDSIRLNHLNKWSYPDNTVTGMSGFIFNLRRPMFQDIRVRKALASVFDFESLNKNSFYSLYQRQICYFDVNKEMRSRGPAKGKVRDLLIELHKKHNTRDKACVRKDAILRGPYVPGVDLKGNLVPIEKRLKAADHYLNSIGWTYDPEKDTRVKDGKPMQIEFLIYNKSLDYVVNPFLENLKKLGIKADYRVVQVAEYVKKLENFDFDMIRGGWGQSMSPGNEQRNYWTTAAAMDLGSRNFCGIENPAIDEAVEKLIDARTRKDLVTWVKVLDRILCANHYVIPGWNSPRNRVLTWQRFGHPDYIPSRTGFTRAVINWWWYDTAKAERLDAAIAAGKPFVEQPDGD